MISLTHEVQEADAAATDLLGWPSAHSPSALASSWSERISSRSPASSCGSAGFKCSSKNARTRVAQRGYTSE